MIRKFAYLFLMLSPVLGVLCASQASSQILQEKPSELQKIDVDEHLGATIPLDLVFTDDLGQAAPISTYFGQGKPVILVLAYYECPMLCTLVLNGLGAGMRDLDWTPGKEFQVLTVSIDPVETYQLAAAKKKNYLATVEKTGIENGWKFFTGDEKNIKALSDAVGFKYFYDEKNRQYAHPAVIMILTEDGKISRYLYGIEFKKQDLRLSLLEASEGKIGSTIDKFILYCFHYDPDSQGYVLFASNIMKLGGAVTLAAIAILMAYLWAREHKRRSTRATAH